MANNPRGEAPQYPAVWLGDDPLSGTGTLDDFYFLIQQIESLGCGEEFTKAVCMAGDLQERLRRELRAKNEEGRPENDPAPRRAFDVEIRVGGDTWDDVVSNLRYLLPHIEDHGAACSSISGGCSSNHTVSVYTNPEMTNERFHQESQAWLDRRAAARRGER